MKLPNTAAAVGVQREPAATANLDQLICLPDFEPAAQQHMSHSTWEYFSSGVADEIEQGRLAGASVAR